MTAPRGRACGRGGGRSVGSASSLEGCDDNAGPPRSLTCFGMSRDVTLCILAGGEGRRMGRPKAELLIHGKQILQHLLEQMAWDGPTLLVTAPGREHPPGWERFDREVVDPVAGLGPLRGVLTALEQAATAIIVLTTVDMPAIPISQLDLTIDHLRSHGDSLGVMTRRIVEGEQQIEP